MRRHILPLLLAVLVLVISGCLDAKKYSDLVYDPKTDTFRMLRVYYHISGSAPEDGAYLASLWQNRDNLLPVEIISIFTESARLRFDAKNYYTIGLGQAGPKPEAPSQSVIDLSKIVNKPGKFFMAGEGSLGYYHQIDIPGAQIDQLLTWGNGEISTRLAAMLDAELARRAKGGAVAKWDAIQQEVLTKLAAKPPAPGDAPPAAEDKGDVPFNTVSADTIKLIQKAITDKQIGITRKGAIFSTSIPATAEDRKAFIGLRDAVKNELLKGMEKEPADPKMKVAASVMDAISIVNDEKAGQIVTTVDYVALRKSIDAAPGLFVIDDKADPAKAEAMTKTIAGAKAAGIEIDEKIKLADIPKMFADGTLPVDSPKKSVEPGTGLFKEGAAKPE